MTKATIWRSLFLGVTALAIGMELWSSFDGDDSTDPWTAMLVRHVPGEVLFAVIGAAVLWLPVHFGIRYWRKHKAAQAAEKEKTHEPQDR